ncbi:MAG: hypothetical protein LBI63_01145 [Candidatus Ancillula sp.]|nr:hypothetical protein [Candidatus Ancillula sp.]
MVLNFTSNSNAQSEDIWRVDPGENRKTTAAQSKPISIPAQFNSGAKIHAVTGATGGSGVSTLASAIAQITSSPTFLVDLQFSGGIDTLLGIEQEEGLRWGAVLKHPVKPKILQDVCPKWNGISVLSNNIENTNYDFSKAISTLLSSSSEFETVVLDIPCILLANKQLLAVLSSLTIIVQRSIGSVMNALAILQLTKNFNLKINIVLSSEHLSKRAKLLPKHNIEQLLGCVIIGELEFESAIKLNIDMCSGPRLGKSTKLRKLVEKLELRTQAQC